MHSKLRRPTLKRLAIAIALFLCSITALAQNADDPASKDDILKYLQTMHSHDMLQKMMEAQAQSTQQLMRDMIVRDNGSVPVDFETHFKKAMGDLVKNMPVDELTQAMIPAYQAHFTHGDIEALNTFYSSPVGQKVLQELSAVVQEGNQAAMPIMSKYLAHWLDRVKQEFEPVPKAPAKKSGQSAPSTN